jgi:hypothetical protein
VGPLTGTTGIGATISHQGHAQFAGVCTATSFSGSVAASQLTGALPAISGANLTNIPVSTGGIVQVKNTTLTAVSSQSIASASAWNYNDAALRVDITASNSANKFLIQGQLCVGSNGLAVSAQLADNGSAPITNAAGDASSNRRQSITGGDNGNSEGVMVLPFHAFVSPGDTNEHKYHFYIWHNAGSTQTVYLNRSWSDSDTNKRGRYISNITVMEIKG